MNFNILFILGGNMKNMMVIISLFAFVFASIIADEKKEKVVKEISPKHNGVVLELNAESGFLEYVHDAEKGEMTIYVLDKDGNPQNISELPKLILFVSKDGAAAKKNLVASFTEEEVKEASKFIVKDDALKNKELNGRIAVAIGQSTFQVNFVYDTQKEKRKREQKIKEEEEALKKKEAEKK